MEEAIGSKITDYLIKPIQIRFFKLEKNLDHSRLISEKNNAGLPRSFRKIAMEMGMVNSY
jgi:hypothetical protein